MFGRGFEGIKNEFRSFPYALKTFAVVSVVSSLAWGGIRAVGDEFNFVAPAVNWGDRALSWSFGDAGAVGDVTGFAADGGEIVVGGAIDIVQLGVSQLSR